MTENVAGGSMPLPTCTTHSGYGWQKFVTCKLKFYLCREEILKYSNMPASHCFRSERRNGVIPRVCYASRPAQHQSQGKKNEGACAGHLLGRFSAGGHCLLHCRVYSVFSQTYRWLDTSSDAVSASDFCTQRSRENLWWQLIKIIKYPLILPVRWAGLAILPIVRTLRTYQTSNVFVLGAVLEVL